jgi:heat-inducible transcriptional repressor
MPRPTVSDLPPRARQILYAAVTEFVETGQPVGSRTLSKKAGLDLSPASIRNVLADLEEAGYLIQPHASAGRVPTDKAFRLYIDALMDRREPSPDDAERIRTGFDAIERGAAEGESVMRQTGRLLSELTGTAAVVVSPRVESLSLKHLRFIRTNPGELLAVMVMSNGSVQNRFLEGRASEADLQRIHNVMDDVTEGRTLGELRDLFARRLASERVQGDDLRRQAFQLGEAAVSNATQRQADVVIEGQAKLLEQPEFADAAGVKQVVTALDERQRLVELLDATMAARGTTVVVGREAGELGGGQLSIVGAVYTDHGRHAGTVGVIGPTRMDYPKVVPLVTATANAMSAYIERSSERSSERDLARRDGDDDE